MDYDEENIDDGDDDLSPISFLKGPEAQTGVRPTRAGSNFFTVVRSFQL